MLLTANHLKGGDAQEICSEIRDGFTTNSAIQRERFWGLFQRVPQSVSRCCTANSKSVEKRWCAKNLYTVIKSGTVLQQIHRFNRKVFEDRFNGHQNQLPDAAHSIYLKKGDVQENCSEIRDRFATNSAIQQEGFWGLFEWASTSVSRCC